MNELKVQLYKVCYRDSKGNEQVLEEDLLPHSAIAVAERHHEHGTNAFTRPGKLVKV